MKSRIVHGDNYQSPFLMFSRSSDVVSVPTLCYLHVEMSRARAGMTDFLIRFSTPRRGDITPSIVTVRGTPQFKTSESVTALCQAVVDQFRELNDNSYDWSKLDSAHLASMIEPHLKTFIKSTGLELLGFSTDALR